MAETTIEWTATDGHPGFSFNPWVGCERVSPGCDHCYAETWSRRTGQPQLWTGERRRTSRENWRKPLRWNALAQAAGVRSKVFCASLADVFDNKVPVEWRHDLWDLIGKCPDLDWLLLTKRPQNAAKMIPWKHGADMPQVWIGATAENQVEADRRIPYLRTLPARVRFLSVEPMLGPTTPCLTGIDWVICGGESGKGRRPFDPDWARALLDACRWHKVPFFMKQWDKVQPIPEDLMVREFPR